MPRVITIDPGKSKCGLVLAEISEKKIYEAIILQSELIDNYVFVSPDLLENKLIVKKGDVITSSILGESELNLKSIDTQIKSLLRDTRDEIKSKGSQVSEIKTNGNFIKKIRDFLQENQNIKFKLEVVSLRDSKTVEPIIVEINILKIAS